MRPFRPPLASSDDRYSRLDGVSRFYARIPASTIAATKNLTANPCIMVPPAGNVDTAQSYTVIDRVYLNGFVSAPNPQFDRAQIILTQYDRTGTPVTTFPFQTGNWFYNNPADPDLQQATQYRHQWNTGGNLVLPPGHSLTAHVSSTSLLTIQPLVTGYRVHRSTAEQMGLNQIICRGATPTSATETALISGISNVHLRIKSLRITSAGGDLTSGQYCRLLFGDGSTFHEIIRVYARGQHQGHWPDLDFPNVNITGPAGYGIYVQLQPNNSHQAFSVNVCAEVVRKSETQLETGAYPTAIASAPNTGGKYFWCSMRGPAGSTDGSFCYLAGPHLSTHVFLIDGCYMQVLGGGGDTGANSIVGINAGNIQLADLGGTLTNTVPSINAWGSITYWNHWFAMPDLGGLPCFSPCPYISIVSTTGTMADSSITFWGRIVGKNSAHPGLGNGSHMFLGNQPA